MATFSLGDAIGSGFGLIRRRPFSVLAWGLAYLIIAVVPAMAAFAWAAPEYVDFLRSAMTHAASAGGRPDPEFFNSMQTQMMPLQAKMMMLQPVFWLSFLLSRAVLAGAVFRAVLEPKNRGFAYLRIGARELWLMLLMFAMFILAWILAVALGVGGVLIGLGGAAALKAANAPTAWIVLSEIVLCALVVSVFIGICLRFSLAMPMTFAEREFRLFESWKLTKGHAWKLFGMALLLIVIVIALGAVIEGGLIAAVLATVGMDSFNQTHVEAFFRQPPEVWMRSLAPWAAVWLLFGSFLTAAFSAIMTAPWAVAYRELTSGGGGAPRLFGELDQLPAAPAAAFQPPADGHGDDHHAPAAPDRGHEAATPHGDEHAADDHHSDDHQADDHHEDGHGEEDHDGDHHDDGHGGERGGH